MVATAFHSVAIRLLDPSATPFVPALHHNVASVNKSVVKQCSERQFGMINLMATVSRGGARKQPSAQSRVAGAAAGDQPAISKTWNEEHGAC